MHKSMRLGMNNLVPIQSHHLPLHASFNALPISCFKSVLASWMTMRNKDTLFFFFLTILLPYCIDKENTTLWNDNHTSPQTPVIFS